MIGNYCRNITNPQITLDLFAESDNLQLFHRMQPQKKKRKYLGAIILS